MNFDDVDEFDLSKFATFEDSQEFVDSYVTVENFELEKQKLFMILASTGVIRAELKFIERNAQKTTWTTDCTIDVTLFDPREAMPPVSRSAWDSDALVIRAGPSFVVPRIFIRCKTEIDWRGDVSRNKIENECDILLVWRMRLSEDEVIHETLLSYSDVMDVRSSAGLSWKLEGFPMIGNHTSYSGLSSSGVAFNGVRQFSYYANEEQDDRFDDVCIVGPHAFGCISFFNITHKSFFNGISDMPFSRVERDSLTNICNRWKTNSDLIFTNVAEYNTHPTVGGEMQMIGNHNHATFVRAVELTRGDLMETMHHNAPQVFTVNTDDVQRMMNRLHVDDAVIFDSSRGEQETAYAQGFSTMDPIEFGVCILYSTNDKVLLDKMMQHISGHINHIQDFSHDRMPFAYAPRLITHNCLHPDLVRGICLLTRHFRMLRGEITAPSLTTQVLRSYNYYKTAQMAWAKLLIDSIPSFEIRVVCRFEQYSDASYSELTRHIESELEVNEEDDLIRIFPQFIGEIALSDFDVNGWIAVKLLLRIKYENSGNSHYLSIGQQRLNLISPHTNVCDVTFGDVAYMTLDILDHPSFEEDMKHATLSVAFRMGHLTPSIYRVVKNLISDASIVEELVPLIDFSPILTTGSNNFISSPIEDDAKERDSNMLRYIVSLCVNSAFNDPTDRALITLQESGFPNSKLFQFAVKAEIFTNTRLIAYSRLVKNEEFNHQIAGVYLSPTPKLLNVCKISMRRDDNDQIFVHFEFEINNYNMQANDDDVISMDMLCRPDYYALTQSPRLTQPNEILWYTEPFGLFRDINFPYNRDLMIRKLRIHNRTKAGVTFTERFLLNDPELEINGTMSFIHRPVDPDHIMQVRGHMTFHSSLFIFETTFSDLQGALYFNRINML